MRNPVSLLELSFQVSVIAPFFALVFKFDGAAGTGAGGGGGGTPIAENRAAMMLLPPKLDVPPRMKSPVAGSTKASLAKVPCGIVCCHAIWPPALILTALNPV